MNRKIANALVVMTLLLAVVYIAVYYKKFLQLNLDDIEQIAKFAVVPCICFFACLVFLFLGSRDLDYKLKKISSKICKINAEIENRRKQSEEIYDLISKKCETKENAIPVLMDSANKFNTSKELLKSVKDLSLHLKDLTMHCCDSTKYFVGTEEENIGQQQSIDKTIKEIDDVMAKIDCTINQIKAEIPHLRQQNNTQNFIDQLEKYIDCDDIKSLNSNLKSILLCYRSDLDKLKSYKVEENALIAEKDKKSKKKSDIKTCLENATTNGSYHTITDCDL
ncbi:hypothetical protein K6025_02660 [Ehrlichia sp. JZT12]